MASPGKKAFALRLDPALHEALERCAAADFRSVNAQVEVLLREALARLEHEGLLTSQPNRGWFVQPMTTDQAEEIYLLRLSVEPAAAAYGCLKAG